MTSYIIEGIDRIGKSTLIDNILFHTGYHHVIHFVKPPETSYYSQKLSSFGLINPIEDNVKNRKRYNQHQYQATSFEAGFELLSNPEQNFIFDRFHLGECVYAPRYRKYDSEYVFEIERKFHADRLSHVKLILLVTSNWNIIEDDGKSFDFTQKEAEQQDFITAFHKSIFQNKKIIDVWQPNGKRKSIDEIIYEINK